MHQHARVLRGNTFEVYVGTVQLTDQRAVVRFRAESGERLVAAQTGDFDAVEFHTLDLPVLDTFQKFGIRNLVRGTALIAQIVEHRHQNDCDDNPQQDVFQ